jgi:hypothetical protein
MGSQSAAVPTRDEITLTLHHAIAMHSIKREWLDDVKLERSEALSFVADELVFRLEKMLWANPLGRIEVSHPASPWEHFRATYFPHLRLGRWFLRRKPVRETTIVKSAYAIFPEAHIAYPDSLGRPVMIIHDGKLIKED